ncbi:hypothetical protein H8B15_15560 [Hymenobacter sp. BT507]|uniref:Uncharacterized protein n=1 Tax=Hymenobacter citatus TaxID=2763506 RepID=A0ABR7MN74_9BACT|nr:hypothetical protein [Hymenobacter citatus]MBC6612344.1 hypothetical protein [Hymenobacter citatus]
MRDIGANLSYLPRKQPKAGEDNEKKNNVLDGHGMEWNWWDRKILVMPNKFTLFAGKIFRPDDVSDFRVRKLAHEKHPSIFFLSALAFLNLFTTFVPPKALSAAGKLVT